MERLLLLSSTRFLEKNPKIFEKPFKDMKMAWITTAQKGVEDKTYIKAHKEFFDREGFNYEEMDLDFENERGLEEKLSRFEIVNVDGGNTYYLMKSIRASGFDKVVKKLLPQGLIYMGGSAGSYITCPTIEMAGFRHQDKYNHYGVTDLTGMNLVPFLMSVHYSPEHHDLLKEKISSAKYPVKILTDNQALLV